MAFASIELLQATESMFPSEGNIVTAAANGDRVLYNKDGGELTYAGTVVLGGYEIWIGPGNQTTASAANPALVHLTGPITSSGTVKFNEYLNHVIYSLENSSSSFTGTVALNHGAGGNGVVQINVGGNGTSNVLSQAEVKFEDKKSNQVLHLEGNATVAGLSTTSANSNVTSNGANNTLTLNSDLNFSYAGVIGAGNYLQATREGDTYTGMNRNGVSTIMNLVKQGSGTQTLTNNNKLGSLTVSSGKVTLGGSGTTTVSTAVSGAVQIDSSATLEVNNTSYVTLSGAQLSGTGTVRYASGQQTAQQAIDLTLLNNSGVTLELKEVKGQLAEGNVINSNIKLTNGAWAGAEWTGAATQKYTFNGTVSGGGNFGITSGVSNGITFDFNGDLSAWTGILRSVNGRTMNVEIGGASLTNTDVGTKIDKNSGTLNLTLSREATFTNDVNISDLTLKAGGVLHTTAGKSFTINGNISMEGSTDLTLAAADANLKEVSLATGASLTLGSIDSHDFKLTSTKITSAGPSTINANVDLTNTTALDIDGAITLGCSLELGDGGVSLEGNLLESLLKGETNSITLFDSVEKVTLSAVDFTGKVEAKQVFSNEQLANYYVEYTGTAVNLTNGNVPEPTTGSLSLLALAGLCARRRKK